jgi:hypothetical protein
MTTTTSAPGADQLSSSLGVSTSRGNASQPARKTSEPERGPATCKGAYDWVTMAMWVARRRIRAKALRPCRAWLWAAAPGLRGCRSGLKARPSRRDEAGGCVSAMNTPLHQGWGLCGDGAELQYTKPMRLVGKRKMFGFSGAPRAAS